MRSDTVFRILFVVYCVEAGVFLIFAPWGPMWARTLSHLPLGPFGSLLLHPLVRGAVSGFGLVHIVWGANDLQSLLRSRRRS